MALTYPLPLADFADLLPIADMTCDLPEVLEMSRTAGGAQLTADLGERLWSGRVNLGNLTRVEVGLPETRLQVVRQGRAFLIGDTRRTLPLLDPTGAILGASAVTILALGADPRELSLAGLPPAYRLSAGDYLSFGYTSGGVSTVALHRVVDPLVTASGAGQTPLFEVVPAIRPGAVAGAAVTLRKPHCRAVVVPGSASGSTGRSTLYEGIGFDWVQSLR